MLFWWTPQKKWFTFVAFFYLAMSMKHPIWTAIILFSEISHQRCIHIICRHIKAIVKIIQFDILAQGLETLSNKVYFRMNYINWMNFEQITNNSFTNVVKIIVFWMKLRIKILQIPLVSFLSHTIKLSSLNLFVILCHFYSTFETSYDRCVYNNVSVCVCAWKWQVDKLENHQIAVYVIYIFIDHIFMLMETNFLWTE